MRALIYHLSLGEMDGTSVVLRRLYEPEATSLRQIYFRPGRFPVPAEFSADYVKGTATWPWRKGARSIQQVWRQLALPSRLSRSPWAAQLKDAAANDAITSLHVVVYDEQTAEFAHRTLEITGPQTFTLHVMDLLLDDALSPASTPHLCWLLKHANAVATVSQRLGEVIRPFTSAAALVWPIPAGFPAIRRNPPASSNAPWQLLMGGAMYAGKTDFLEHVFLPAWKQFHQVHPHSELVYMGKDIDGIPPSVRASLRPLGVVPHDKVAETLRAASAAFLPILHEASTPWRYSVPARISDYFAAGLPVIAPHSEGTATHDFLLQAGSPAATLVAQSPDVLAALNRLHDDPAHWLAASHAASDFAARHLDLEKLRAQLFAFMA